jgi:hypothetical protein
MKKKTSINDPTNRPLDENRNFYNNVTRRTPLHSFSPLIKDFHTLNDEIAKRKKNESNL